MNAVKRCLALFAATLWVGACGGDPTANDAGANLRIRATPGAVWVQNTKSATVLIEAIDGLNGTQPGNWTAAVTGPFTVVQDTTYQNTSAGPIGNGRSYVVTPTSEGDGFVVFTGTGGSDTVPIRVSPNDTTFHLTANDSTPVLFQPITLTAPPGIVFTGGTTVRFVTGPLAADSGNGGLSFPTILSMSADSTQITFVPGPGAHGYAKITGIASRSTPTLTSTARTAFQFSAVPSVDTLTAGFDLTPHFALSTNRTMPNVLDTLIMTAPAGYVFLPSTSIEFFRLVGANITASNPDGYTVANGTAAPVKISLSTDSTVLKYAVAPGSRGRIKLKNIAFRNAPGINFRVRDLTANTFDLRSGVAGAPDTSNVGFTFSKASPIAEGDTVTITAPAGWVFLPGTASINAGSSSSPSGGDSARIAKFSLDSTKVVISLAPGASGKLRYGSVARRDIPKILWQARGGAISAAAAPAVVATMSPTTGNMNDTITVALSGAGPYRFRPTSQATLGGFASLVTSISTDSLTMKLLPPPGFTGQLTLTNIRYASLPTFQVVAATAASLTVNAATSLGQDDPKAGAVPIFNGPAALGAVVGFWDQATTTAADYTPDGATRAQYIRIHATRTGNVLFSVDWSQGTASNTDIDFILVADDGSFDAPVGGVTSGAASGKPESATYALTAGTDYVLALIDYGPLDGFGALASTTAIKVTMTGK